MNHNSVLGNTTPDTTTSALPNSSDPVCLSSMSSMSPPLNDLSGPNVLFPPMPSSQPWEGTLASPRLNAGPADPTVRKVAIPRLTALTASHRRRRSARACEACRTRKGKCDGVRPVCGQCAYHNKRCTFQDVKRVRDQKMLDTLVQRVDRYEALLRELEVGSDSATTRRIRKELMVC
jgi:hypothetical protein